MRFVGEVVGGIRSVNKFLNFLNVLELLNEDIKIFYKIIKRWIFFFSIRFGIGEINIFLLWVSNYRIIYFIIIIFKIVDWGWYEK